LRATATLRFPPFSPKVRKRANRGVGRVRERHFWTSEKDVQKCPPGPSQTTPSLTDFSDFPQTSRNGRVGSRRSRGGWGVYPPPPGNRYHYSRGRPLARPSPNRGLGGSGPTSGKVPFPDRSDLSFRTLTFSRFRETSKSEGPETEVRSTPYLRVVKDPRNPGRFGGVGGEGTVTPTPQTDHKKLTTPTWIRKKQSDSVRYVR
jgi:hypothetical protein